MARVTVEDCVDKVPNRFELVMLAAHRAREIAAGSTVTVDRDNDKNPVVSLREIADETQSADELRERLIESNQNQMTQWRFLWGLSKTSPKRTACPKKCCCGS